MSKIKKDKNVNIKGDRKHPKMVFILYVCLFLFKYSVKWYLDSLPSTYTEGKNSSKLWPPKILQLI